MKRALYAVLAVVIVFSVVIVGVKLKQKAGEGNIEVTTQAEVERQIDILKEQQPQAFKGDRGKMAEKSYRQTITEQVKLNEMIKQEAVARGVAVPDSEVDIAVNQVRQAYGTSTKFDQALVKQKMTLDEYKNSIKNQLTMSKMMLVVTKDVKIKDSEAKAFYNTNKAELKKPFDEVSDIIKQRLLQQRQRAKFNEFIQDLKERMGND